MKSPDVQWSGVIGEGSPGYWC